MGDRRNLAAWLVLLLLTLAVFGQTAGHGFLLYDDDDYISGNPVVSRGLTVEGIRWAFGFHLFNWHPLTWLSHMLDTQLFGPRPGPRHLVSAVLHALNAVLLFTLLRTATGAFGRSLAAAALFAVHPLRVESVAWLAERKDLLAGLFWILALLAWTRYGRRPRASRYLLSLLFFGLALMSKPTSATLPLVLLLWDWWPMNRLSMPVIRSRLLEKVPFLALSCASALMTLRANDRQEWPLVTPDLPARMANALVSAATYLKQSVLPNDLAIFYPFPRDGHPAWMVLGAGLLLAVLTAASLAWWRRRYLVTGWFWFLLALIPVIGIMQVGAQAHADRYTYLPSMGLSVAVVWLVADFAPGRTWRVPLAVATGTAATLALAAAAMVQTSLWGNQVALYRHAVEVTRDNAVMLNNLSVALQMEGRNEEAARAAGEAVRVEPRDGDSWHNLGVALFRLGRFPESVQAYRQALERGIDARTYLHLGDALLGMGSAEEAVRAYRLSLWLDNSIPETGPKLESALKLLDGARPASPVGTAPGPPP